MDDFLQLENYTVFENMPTHILKNMSTATTLLHACVSQEIFKTVLTCYGHF